MTTDFQLPVRVYWEDTDGAGVVYHARYLAFLDRARTEWLRQSTGYDQAKLALSSGIAFAVVSLQCDYLRAARLDDLLLVKSQIAEHSRASVTFSQSIYRDDELLFTARIRLACVNLTLMKPVAIPENILRAF